MLRLKTFKYSPKNCKNEFKLYQPIKTVSSVDYGNKHPISRAPEQQAVTCMHNIVCVILAFLSAEVPALEHFTFTIFPLKNAVIGS